MLVNVEKISHDLNMQLITSNYSKLLTPYSGISNNSHLVCNKSTEGYAPLLGVNNLFIKDYSDFVYFFKDINKKLSSDTNRLYAHEVNEKVPRYLKNILISKYYAAGPNLKNINYDVSSDYQLPIESSIKRKIREYLHSPVNNYSIISNLSKYESISIESLLSPYINTGPVDATSYNLIGNGVFSTRCIINNENFFIPIFHLEIKKEYIPYYRLAYIMDKPISLKFFKLHVLNLKEDSNVMQHVQSYHSYRRLVRGCKKVIDLDWGEVVEHSEKEMREFYEKKFTENIKIPINKQKEFKKAILSNFINAKKNKFVRTVPNIFERICN